MIATGFPPNTAFASDGGRESQSTAFLKTPGIELLYSGVDRINPLESAIAFFDAATRGGIPSAASTSPLYKGMPSIVSIFNSAPVGISSVAARRSAELNEARRRLPEIPIIVATK